VQLGIADRVWSLGDLIDAALAVASPDPTETAPERRRKFRLSRAVGHEPRGLSAQEIAEEVAQIAAVIMKDAPPPSEYAPSLMFRQGYFSREIIERVEIVWGLRRVAVPNVVLKIDFNLDKFPLFADCVRRSLISAMGPLLEGSGRVCQATPEGVVVILG
jgi:hypothetical protein